ncbi:hypothetical protein SYK_06630 [Pseudodesulfovibrio nedwellii]|uniref:Uncharacterized protein n=1 Tax=Pseudodesulfovibrio nedwellii TaxID=2973072 RepID=A0ABM8AXR9_9BACT|nr:hypothetical protein [Pseudodesulfovibrio nedwellii]BDQ36303.1 hypothetical protein SYK_06630 [Pseudodesulfovibrio nedwellii]
MANVLWKTLLPYVLPEVDKCPKAQIVNEIRRAAITFCQRSQIWQKDLDYLFFPAGVATADLDPPQESRVCEVISVSHLNGEELIAGTHFTATTDIVTILVMISQDTKLIPTVALKPTLLSTGIPEGLMEDWGKDIAYGAVASLKAMRGREWEDIPGAQIKNELFEDGIASAKIRAITGGAKRSLQVKPRSFM